LPHHCWQAHLYSASQLILMLVVTTQSRRLLTHMPGTIMQKRPLPIRTLGMITRPKLPLTHMPAIITQVRPLLTHMLGTITAVTRIPEK